MTAAERARLDADELPAHREARLTDATVAGMYLSMQANGRPRPDPDTAKLRAFVGSLTAREREALVALLDQRSREAC